MPEVIDDPDAKRRELRLSLAAYLLAAKGFEVANPVAFADLVEHGAEVAALINAATSADEFYRADIELEAAWLDVAILTDDGPS